MDSPLDNQDCQASDGDVHPVSSTSGSSKMHDKVASLVADKMLHMISQKIVPPGFDSPGFVRNSFVETFGQGHQAMACSTSERDTHGPLAKRKRCSVVDSALGVMGYDTLKVSDTKERFLVDMLTSLVQSTASCGPVCYYPNGQGAISTQRSRRMSVGTLLQIVDNCKSFFASVRYDGTQALEIVDALVKVVTDTSLFVPREESASGIFNKTIYGQTGPRRMDHVWAIQSVLNFALEQKRSIYLKLQPCSRLRFWRIRPACLKQDISDLANEARLRLFLRLDRELSQREDWAILVVCLALAPEMFMEARRLLHHWFLSSGVVRLWELRAELVAAVWDVVSHPSLWRLTNDIHLPPKFAGYPGVLRPFVQILEGPPTIIGVFKLLKLIDDMEKLRINPDMEISGHGALSQRVNDVDHNSIWSLLIDVLPWFIFASKLLFRSFNPNSTNTSEREVYESVVYYGKQEGLLTESEYDVEHLYSQTAARYLAWILSPANRVQRASEEQMLLMISRGWDKFQGLRPGTRLPLSGQHDFGALKAAVQASCIKCTSCGSPVKEAKTGTDEFVASCVSDTAQTNGERAISGVQSLPKCHSCMILQQNERSYPEDREKRPGHPAASTEVDERANDVKGGSQVHSRNSSDWQSGVAVALNILDFLDGDDLSMAGGSDQSVDSIGEKSRVTNNLAVIVARFVEEWARSMEALYSKTSSFLEEKKIYKSALEDMLIRFCSWMAKLSISAEAASICNDTKELVAIQLKNEMSSPLTP